MLGRRVRRGVGTRCVCRNRAVIDNAPTARLLSLHDVKSLLGAEKRACEIDLDHGLPLLEGEVLEIDCWGADAGIVEQQVKAAKAALHSSEEAPNRRGIADIRRNGQAVPCCVASKCKRLFEGVLAPPRQGDAISVGEQGEGDGASDAGPGSGDYRGSCRRRHGWRLLEWMRHACGGSLIHAAGPRHGGARIRVAVRPATPGSPAVDSMPSAVHNARTAADIHRLSLPPRAHLRPAAASWPRTTGPCRAFRRARRAVAGLRCLAASSSRDEDW